MKSPPPWSLTLSVVPQISVLAQETDRIEGLGELVPAIFRLKTVLNGTPFSDQQEICAMTNLLPTIDPSVCYSADYSALFHPT